MILLRHLREIVWEEIKKLAGFHLLGGVAKLMAFRETGFYVTRIWSMELPRSLVDIVTDWNFPVHKWLKTCTFFRLYVGVAGCFAHTCVICLFYVQRSGLCGVGGGGGFWGNRVVPPPLKDVSLPLRGGGGGILYSDESNWHSLIICPPSAIFMLELGVSLSDVFMPLRSRGMLTAVVATYVASALLHVSYYRTSFYRLLIVHRTYRLKCTYATLTLCTL